MGDWALTRPDGCAVVYSFRADGAYVGGLACTLSGAGEIQVDAGDFALAGKTVSFVPHRASCAAVAPYSAGYALTPSLTLTTGSGAIYAFTRVPGSMAPGTSGTAQFGCFTDAGFVPRAVMDL